MPQGATSRLRFGFTEYADLYARLLAAKAFEKSGAALTASCNQILRDVKQLATNTSNNQSNPYRQHVLQQINAEHIVKVYKAVVEVKVPDTVWKRKTQQNDQGETIFVLGEDGGFVFEIDDNGHRFLSPTLPPYTQTFYPNLLALRRRIQEQQASSEQTENEVRDRARNMRLARIEAARKRRETYGKQKRKVKHRVRKDRKREQESLRADMMMKRTFGMQNGAASVRVANAIEALVQHITGSYQTQTPMQAAVSVENLPPTPSPISLSSEYENADNGQSSSNQDFSGGIGTQEGAAADEEEDSV